MDRIGPYRIIRKLGEGGMGVVYAAEDERLNRAHARGFIHRDLKPSNVFLTGHGVKLLSWQNVKVDFNPGSQSKEPKDTNVHAMRGDR